MTNSGTLITIFGGSGFLGRHIVRMLAGRRYRLRVAVRRPYLVRYPGQAGQIEAFRADVQLPRSVESAVRGAEIVINLVGILSERSGQRFDAVQEQGAGAVARATAKVGAKLIHISSIGADATSRARYARSKARGDAAVLAEMPGATIFRPSIVFGPDDEFFNRLGEMARMLPFLPLIDGGQTRFQPVFVGDVARAVGKAVVDEIRPGTIYELGGPDVMTLQELMEIVLAAIGRRRFLVSVPLTIAELQAAILQFLPGAPLTPDQVELLVSDNVVSAAAEQQGRTLAGLGIDPASIASIVPRYLRRFRT